MEPMRPIPRCVRCGMIRGPAGWHPERRRGPVVYRYGLCPFCRLEALFKRRRRPSAFQAHLPLAGWVPDRPPR
jgi:hypothetical protein